MTERVESGSSESQVSEQDQRLSRLWTYTLLYVLFVILFGAVVRITGSGAGCGQHWPTCHGEVTHLPKTLETLIELTHRVTSGLSMLVIFGLTWLTFRRVKRGHPARRAAALVSIFITTEALVGAGLVLLELVGKNDSGARAWVMGAHLVNTFALVFTLVLVIFSFKRAGGARLQFVPFGARGWGALGALVILVVSAAGAVTALGDTLYPVAEEATRGVELALESTTEQSTHFLERLRGVHPLLAVLGSLILFAGAPRLSAVSLKYVAREHGDAPPPLDVKLSRAVAFAVVGQVLLGLVNIGLSAPGWMQVVHLGAANVLWILWCAAWMSGSESLEQREGEQ